MIFNSLSAFGDPGGSEQEQQLALNQQLLQSRIMRKESSNNHISLGTPQIIHPHNLVLHIQQQPSAQILYDQANQSQALLAQATLFQQLTQNQPVFYEHDTNGTLNNLMVPQSNQQTQPQVLLEPFATHFIQQYSMSDINSLSVSNKNSFHTDDSQNPCGASLNNQQQDQQKETVQFTRQSTHTTIRNSKNQNIVNNGLKSLKLNDIEQDEEIELNEEPYDTIKIIKLDYDQISEFNCSSVQIIDKNKQNDQQNPDQSLKADLKEKLNDEDEKLNQSEDSSQILNVSLQSYLLSNSTSPFIPENNNSKQAQSQLKQETQYQTLAIGQSIWSPQPITSTQLSSTSLVQKVNSQSQAAEYQVQQTQQSQENQIQQQFTNQQIPIQISQQQQPQQLVQTQNLQSSPIQTILNQQQILLNQDYQPTTNSSSQYNCIAKYLKPLASANAHIVIDKLNIVSDTISAKLSQNQQLNQQPHLHHPSVLQDRMINLRQEQLLEYDHNVDLINPNLINQHPNNMSPTGSIDPNLEQNSQLLHMCGNRFYKQHYILRQINRHLLNPIYKVKNHNGLKPPPGLSHIDPLHLSESQISKYLMEQRQLENQMILNGIDPYQIHAQNSHDKQFELAQPIPKAPTQQLQMMNMHQQLPHQQISRHQDWSPQINGDISSNRLTEEMIETLRIQSQNETAVQQQPQQLKEMPKSSSKSEDSQYDHQFSAYSSFFQEQFQKKKSALDEQLRRTTQQLEKKLIENLEIQKIWDTKTHINPGETDQDEEEEDEEDIDALSLKSDTQSANNEGIQDELLSNEMQKNKKNGLINENDDYYNSLIDQQYSLVSKHPRHSGHSVNNVNQQFKEQMLKQKTELFQKLQEQLNQLKNEIFSQNEQEFNSASPFKQDPCSYLEKILNLMTICNEVDQTSNIDKIKKLISKYDKTKLTLREVKEQRIKFFENLSAVNMQLHDLECNYYNLIDENNNLRDKQSQEIERLEFIIKSTYENIKDLTGDNTSADTDQYEELFLKLSQQEQKQEDNSNQSAQNQQQQLKQQIVSSDVQDIAQAVPQALQSPLQGQNQLNQQQLNSQPQFRQRKETNSFLNLNKNAQGEDTTEYQYQQDCYKKITEQQVEIDDLREYIKKRSQEENKKRMEDKHKADQEIVDLKQQIDKMNKSHVQVMKEKDIELKAMQDHILRIDCDYLSKNQFNGGDKIKECSDCKKKDSKVNDLEKRIVDLTEYIKKNKERIPSGAVGSAEINKDAKIFIPQSRMNQQNNNSTIENLRPQTQNQFNPQEIQTNAAPLPQYMAITIDLLSKFERLIDYFVAKDEQLQPSLQESKINIQQMKSLLRFSNQSKIISRHQRVLSQGKVLEEIKEEFNEDEQDNLSLIKLQPTNQQYVFIKDSFKELVAYFQSQLNIMLSSNQNDQTNNLQQNQNKKSATSAETTEQKIKELDYLSKVDVQGLIQTHYKELSKEGRIERKSVHQVIVDVEKFMYQMNSLFVTEQMNLESFKNMTDEQKIMSLKQQPQIHLDQRLSLNDKQRELFSIILETYLQLPLKLKPIFDKMKNFETLMSKFYKSDTSLIQDLVQSFVVQYEAKKADLIQEQSVIQKQNEDNQNLINQMKEESEQLKQKIVQLSEKIVQINSAYNALQKHMNSLKPTQQPSQTTSQQQQQPIQQVQAQPQAQPEQKITSTQHQQALNQIQSLQQQLQQQTQQQQLQQTQGQLNQQTQQQQQFPTQINQAIPQQIVIPQIQVQQQQIAQPQINQQQQQILQQQLQLQQQYQQQQLQAQPIQHMSIENLRQYTQRQQQIQQQILQHQVALQQNRQNQQATTQPQSYLQQQQPFIPSHLAGQVSVKQGGQQKIKDQVKQTQPQAFGILAQTAQENHGRKQKKSNQNINKHLQSHNYQ
ncbi:UNKNOWN [Stylonychia lemnae]|uniref:Uncharacterized protein n=1 Tax=Stylonychia lemnae TaxID=5949 RepID=A0A077ZZ34_STYLE|nr:UNKNOWN [Stylonychia lemnae]|eukprot:CDW75185.1 UNKNOWN [Stylonychia lemnae]